MKKVVSGFDSFRKDSLRKEELATTRNNSSPSFWDNQTLKKNLVPGSAVPGHWDRPVITVEPPVPNGRKDGDWTQVPQRQKFRGRGHSPHQPQRGASASPQRSATEMEGETVKEGGGKKEGAGKGKGRKKTPSSFGSAKIDIEGVEAAPIDFFIGNTNPKIDVNKVKEVIVKCGSLEMKASLMMS